MRSTIDAAIGHIEAAESLDRPGYSIGKAISRANQIVGRPGKAVGNFLHGQPYGHPIHPLLVAIPIGTWTLTLGLDLLTASGLMRDRAASRAADISLQAGVPGALAAIATGLADWQHLNGRDRRVGLVHGGVNLAATALNLVSIRLRGQERRAAGIGVSLAAYALVAASSYLGGHLVYRRRAAVDHADRSPVPRDFVPTVALDMLVENKPHRVAFWDEVQHREIGVALVRQGERVHAIGARCSHAGGPLDQGWIFDGALVCPWHGSRYDLQTGQPSTGPSTCPQPRYEVRLRDGTVEIRREQEPGDHVVTSASLAREPGAARTEQSDTPPASRTAIEVLFEHHELMRRLFERMLAPAGDDETGHDQNRHDLMRTLAAELDIHEVVEDAIFYPSIRAVSEDTEIAYAEHGVLADLVAATVKQKLGTPEFRDHLLALQAAFLHHAGSEERSMFREAERLDQAVLLDLGRQLDERLDRERSSRARQAFRDLKIRLMEKI